MSAITQCDFIQWHKSGAPMDEPSPPSARGGKPARGEPVVARTLRLLSAFRHPEETLTLTALAARSRLSKSTALRLARHLLDWGALERTADGGFVIGLRLLEVASLAPRGHGLRATAMPFLEDLHHATGQHVLLAVRDGSEAVLVERLSARGAGLVDYHVGGRLPLQATGVGLVLLAFAPSEVRERVLGAPVPAVAGADPIGPDELRRKIAAIRREGAATNTRSVPDRMSSVAAPVLGPAGEVVAALSVIAPTDTFEPASARPAVIAVARAVSRALRGPDGSSPRAATTHDESGADDAGRSAPGP